MRSYLSSSPEQTRQLGRQLAALLFDGACLCLHGDLGAGKTCLAQGILQGMGVQGPIQSPTFALIHEYPDARIPLCHADLYRLDTPLELAGIGLVERLGEGIWLVEWAEKFPSIWPEDRLDVELLPYEEGRELRLSATGPRHLRLEQL